MNIIKLITCKNNQHFKVTVQVDTAEITLLSLDYGTLFL